jgi:hypothetical protein
MADEFIADIGSSNQVPLDKIERALCSANRYRVERRSESKIGFFTGYSG